jgi:hypothetical protein
MNNVSEDLVNKEIAMAVNEYLKLQAAEHEHEDDISFWSVNTNTATETEQEAGNDTLGIP